jgi:DNA (cytosine-5)-methyltransferase 1
MSSKKKPGVAELFAGVGGFRLGLERAGWEISFSNQWEPSTKKQHASKVYVARFGPKNHSNVDIGNLKTIPKKFELLVGGFPCQDYSVAKGLSRARGLEGKKGVLWWEILRLVKKHKPKYILLENVERLLKSPAKQRGRDFAVMLRSLGNQGYLIEWRVINAADYGFPQKRSRIFIVAKKQQISKAINPALYILNQGILAKSFICTSDELTVDVIPIGRDLAQLSKEFNRGGEKPSPFKNAGVYFDGVAYTMKVLADPRRVNRKRTLGDILERDSNVHERYFVSKKQLGQWKFQKGAKRLKRQHKKSGFSYNYSEGSIAFPDFLERPSRTILTGEGGSGPSRFKHIIRTRRGYRRLTPIELERLNGFPDDWTRFDDEGKEMSDSRRGFFMGNALVVGLVEMVGKQIRKDLEK